MSNAYAAFAEQDALDQKRAVEAQANGEPVIVLGEQVFRAAPVLHAWHMIQLAKCELRGDLMGAMAHFGEFIDSAVHPDDLPRLHRHMSRHALGLAELRDDVGAILMAAATQAGFGEDEDEDPTGPPDAGRPTPSPTPGS